MSLDHVKLALNNVSKSKIRSWLTMIGIFIGITAIVSLIGLGQGLEDTVLQQFSFLGSDVIFIRSATIQGGPPGAGAVNPLSNDIHKKIGRINGVDASFKRNFAYIPIEFNDVVKKNFAIGTAPENDNLEVLKNTLNIDPIEGRFLQLRDKNKVYLGNNFLSESETLFDKQLQIGSRIEIQNKKFEVVGFNKKKGSFILDNMILVFESELESIVGSFDSADFVLVKVHNEKEIPRIKKDIERLLRKERKVKEGKEDFEVQTPASVLKNLQNTLLGVQLFFYVIAAISILVGGIGIMNTMFTSVLERTREIGIMKAIGATKQDILSIFVIESGFFGLIGGVVGVICGYLLALLATVMAKQFLGTDILQMNISPFLVISTLTFSFVLGTIFGLVPALQAANASPIDSLRK